MTKKNLQTVGETTTKKNVSFTPEVLKAWADFMADSENDSETETWKLESESIDNIDDAVKYLKECRGGRVAYIDSDSKSDELSDEEEELLQGIANRLGEVIYAGNHWTSSCINVYTVNDIFEDFLAFDQPYMTINDYVDRYFSVFKPEED